MSGLKDIICNRAKPLAEQSTAQMPSVVLGQSVSGKVLKHFGDARIVRAAGCVQNDTAPLAEQSDRAGDDTLSCWSPRVFSNKRFCIDGDFGEACGNRCIDLCGRQRRRAPRNGKNLTRGRDMVVGSLRTGKITEFTPPLGQRIFDAGRTDGKYGINGFSVTVKDPTDFG